MAINIPLQSYALPIAVRGNPPRVAPTFAISATMACAVPDNSGGLFSKASTPYKLIAVYNEKPMPKINAEIIHNVVADDTAV